MIGNPFDSFSGPSFAQACCAFDTADSSRKSETMSSVPPKGAAKRKTIVAASESSIEESQKSAKRLETICCICRDESAKKYYPVSLGGRVMVALVNSSVPRNLDSASMSF
jgi:hypothetical protein